MKNRTPEQTEGMLQTARTPSPKPPPAPGDRSRIEGMGWELDAARSEVRGLRAELTLAQRVACEAVSARDHVRSKFDACAAGRWDELQVLRKQLAADAAVRGALESQVGALNVALVAMKGKLDASVATQTRIEGKAAAQHADLVRVEKSRDLLWEELRDANLDISRIESADQTMRRALEVAEEQLAACAAGPWDDKDSQEAPCARWLLFLTEEGALVCAWGSDAPAKWLRWARINLPEDER